MGYTTLQKYAIDILNAGYNVFLSGNAGTGKTYVIQDFIKSSQEKGMNVMITAPTGIAALNIGGVTLHHQFKAPLYVIDCKNKSYDYDITELKNTDVLIIDEISMCRLDLFDFIANHILLANSHRKAAGKPFIQLVVVGDLFQLPPVTLPNEKYKLDQLYGFDTGLGFPIYSEFWEMFKFKNIILTEVIRQESIEFSHRLDKLRVGDKTVIDYFYENSCKYEIEDAISLYALNEDVNNKNQLELNKIPGEVKYYHAKIDGKAKIDDTLAVEHLELKQGARVMCISNGIGSYVNGALGTVLELYDNSVLVAFDTGVTVEIQPYIWNIQRYEVVDTVDNKPILELQSIGTVEQIPLKLAYAVTIHKSQGQTYDKVNIHPYSWDCGQLYVALSRVKDIHNMYLDYRIQPYYSKTSLNVIKFYNSIIDSTNSYVDTSKNILDEQKKDVYSDDMKKVSNNLKNLFTKC